MQIGSFQYTKTTYVPLDRVGVGDHGGALLVQDHWGHPLSRLNTARLFFLHRFRHTNRLISVKNRDYVSFLVCMYGVVVPFSQLLLGLLLMLRPAMTSLDCLCLHHISPTIIILLLDSPPSLLVLPAYFPPFLLLIPHSCSFWYYFFWCCCCPLLLL